ncbi:MAG: prephenate dehydrogenase/arogenate dehydrogenase family protein [Chloroflexi bacterium]|nr:prephenate dehydrogenase/arogenate dehydrogenase family protein [Chloroflexota bacterium]
MDRVVIIGLGLIGGSLGLALKGAKIKDIEVIGVDVERDAVVAAQRKGAVDRVERPAEKAVASANMVIVATPILAVRDVFATIGDALPAGCVVTDTASTKAHIMRWAEEFLPPHVHFVGGHPMAGKERPGIQGAEASLFRDAAYCIVPSARASQAAVETVVGLAQTVGSTPYFVDAEEHDMMVAGVSHLPLVLASALVAVTTRSPSWREMSKLASSGFRDTSRLASTDIALSTGIAGTNQAGLIRWIDGCIEVLKEYRDLIAQDSKAMQARFDEAWEARERWLVNQKEPPRDKAMAEVPSTADRINEMLFGNLWEKLRRREQQLLDRDGKGRQEREQDR